jgi:hypothetical protein
MTLEKASNEIANDGASSVRIALQQGDEGGAQNQVGLKFPLVKTVKQAGLGLSLRLPPLNRQTQIPKFY